MKTFEYILKDENGIHARPAGVLVKTAEKYSSKIQIMKDGRTADCKKIFSVMGMGARKGDKLEITVEGADEDAAFNEIKKLFEENF